MKILFLVLNILPFVKGLVIEPGSLRADGATTPLGLTDTTPSLSWRLSSTTRGDAQTAYQVQVASMTQQLESPDFWDSGKVSSNQPFAVYAGKTLASRQAVVWRARVWGVDDTPSPWSDVTSFEMGLLNNGDWTADWIVNSQFKTGTNSLPMFAKEFSLGCAVEKARLYIVGLGVFLAEMNGQAVSNEILGPGYSTINRTVLYRTYDVTSMLRPGSNVLGVALGKGIYDAEAGLHKRYMKFIIEPKPLLVRSQLEYICAGSPMQSVLSDQTWLTTVEGPQIESSWYGGEEYDARKIIPNWSSQDGNRTTWQNANISTGPPGPPGQLINQVAPPLEITERVPAKSVAQAGNQWVFDFGINYAGWYTFTMNGTGMAGTRIVFYPAENITAAGAPDQSSTGSPIFDGYTLAGLESESYSPKFMYHGNRYIGVNTTWVPSVSDMTGQVIRAVNENAGSVATSNTLFNEIHGIIDEAIKSNMYSVLTDCPTREKLGWLEQDHLVFESIARGYDIQAYGHDFVRTIADAQVQWGPPGLIPATAPEYDVFAGEWIIYRDDPNWGNAVMIFPLELYRYYGDVSPLETYYPIMVQYMAYLATRQNSSALPIIDDGGLADWEGIDTTTPTGLTSTYAYQQAAAAMEEIALALQKPADAAQWAQLEVDIQAAFHKTWFNTSGGLPHYSADSQASNALALDMGAVPTQYQAAVFQSLLDGLEVAGWHWTVGEIGLPALFRVLMAQGRNDILYTLMSQTTATSYGYQIVHGATSLWEHWDGNNGGVGSLNHLMFGFGDMWLQRLSGLAPSDNSLMWETIDYAPIIVGDLTSASSSYRTPAGFANASWVLDGTALSYDIVVPVGARGFVTLNGTNYVEGGMAIDLDKPGIVSYQVCHGVTKIEVGSGTYSFYGTI